MLRPSKLLAGVLLAVSAAAVFPVIVWAGSASQVAHGTGCHHQFPTTPAPRHDGHQCCLSGHQCAVPGSAVTLRPVVTEGVIHVESRDLCVRLLRDGPPAFLSHSPPVNTSLRI